VFHKIINFYKTGADRPPCSDDPKEVARLYEQKRWSVFLSITLGYAIYYVCRQSFAVVKKPMLDAKIFNAEEMGRIGAALLLAYAFGKFCNGFLADSSNIRRFMASGLLISSFINLFLGFTTWFWVFFILWGINGWFQSMGSAPSVVALAQWFSNRERGTRYGVWFIAHNIGEGIAYAGIAYLVAHTSWRWGFWGTGMLGVVAALIMLRTLADRPQTYGLPPVAEYKNDYVAGTAASQKGSLFYRQLEIFHNPVVWILGLSSAMAYVARYAVSNWGILYLQEDKHYQLETAGLLLGLSQVGGFFGAAFCGYFSDRFFGSRRNVPTLIYGLLQTASLVLFFATPAHMTWLSLLSLSLFGFAISGSVVFLGGLTAVDLCPKRVTGAVMGFIGLFSYLGAAAQDWLSGYLIHIGQVVVDGKVVYHFDKAIAFWVAASVLSLLLPCLIWNAKPQD
jgi:OPA family sugar phosphate sensor protein UhpC-like MFS transporter